jgi:parallel beta-helix repeat protein
MKNLNIKMKISISFKNIVRSDMISKVFTRILLLIAFIALVGIEAKAQFGVMDASVKVYNKPFTPLTTWIWSTGGPYYYTSVSLSGFTNFFYDNRQWTYITMFGGGAIAFADYTIGGRYPAYYYAQNQEYLYYWSEAMVYGYWLLMDTWYDNLGTMKIGLVQEDGNDVVVFEWLNTKWYYSYYQTSSFMNLQIRLHRNVNKIEIHYGKMVRGSDIGTYSYYGYHNGLIGFSGYPTSTRWINIDPTGNGNAGYGTWEWYKYPNNGSNGFGPYTTIRNNADHDYIQTGDCIMYAFGPEFKAAYPIDNVTLIKNYIYGNGTTDILGHGNEQHPGVLINNVKAGAIVNKTISGPMSFPTHPNYKVVYNATNNISSGVTLRYNTPTSGAPSNPAFGTTPNGSLDLVTNVGQISGGSYLVRDELTDGDLKKYTNDYYVSIANTYDLEITRVLQPKPSTILQYANNSSIPIAFRLTNRGITEIKKFSLVVDIYKDLDKVYHDSIYWNHDPGITVAQETDLNFLSYYASKVGTYKVKATAYYVGDQELTNNYIPWLGQADYTFEVANEIDGAAWNLIQPSNKDLLGNNVDIFVGRPVRPQGRFKNYGITDISDANCNLVIKRKQDNKEVYNKNAKIPSIPAGVTNNEADLLFDYFTPDAPGDYVATLTIDALDDAVESNNFKEFNFKVIHAMAGTYTIGPNKNTGDYTADSVYNSRNFESVQLAADGLFKKGITAPVVFEFTQSTYEVGDITLLSLAPALDLRSTVTGMSSTNTVTFKPSSSLSMSRSSITINLYSKSGIGILMGQSELPINSFAPVYIVSKSSRKLFANSAGYFIFDGGIQKSLKFVLKTTGTTRLGAAFYLSQGASNNTIKNCIITSEIPAERYDDWKLPLTTESNGSYSFQLDVRNSNTESYSAGIVLRSVSPTEELNLFDPAKQSTARSNTINMDTLVNQNNLITKNEISGYAYGIVSIGIGALSRGGKATKFFNYNNTFSGNLIYDVSRAGVYLGYEDNTKVTGNKIYGVGKAGAYQANTDVAGIMAGGEKNSTWYPYSNTNLFIDGNEMSYIGSGLNSVGYASYGIKIEQGRNSYINSSLLIPNKNENIIIMNNVIWGLLANDAASNRFGIRLYTMRTAPANWNEPSINTYWTYGDRIVNNTIIIPDDGFNTSGMVAGVAIQNGWNTNLLNNTIAMADNNNSGNLNYHAALLYQGLKPGTTGGIISDNNLFWTRPDGTPTDSAALVRYIETNSSSTVISWGSRNEFLNVAQWQMTTGSDLRSLVRNFVAELTTPVIGDINSKLRVNSVPKLPVNSPMNNRGLILSYVLYDIDGNTRGMSGQSYDIGAFEFNGDMLNSDVEVLTTSQPGAYQSSPDPLNIFSDAEYIMTKAPVEVKAELRNNGKLEQTGLDVKVQIYRQKPRASHSDPLNFYTKPELTQTIMTSIPVGTTQSVAFGLKDGVGADFYPTPYADWRIKYQGNPAFADSLYTIEECFSTMENNVTPLYKIVVSVRADEDVYNNVYTKVCRFYIKRSQLDLLLSVENTPYPLTNNDIRAGKRNYDSLLNGFKGIGWVNKWVTMEIDTYLVDYYDIFERTGWEPRAVDYSIYKTVIWSDADDKDLSTYQIADLERFLDSGTPEFKKNLVVSSQEMVRQNWDNDQSFVMNYLNAKLDLANYYTDPLNFPITTNHYTAGTGNPYSITDNTKWIVGTGLGRTWKQYILSTGLNDPNPVPGLMMVNPASQGLTLQAYQYNGSEVLEKVAGKKDPTMGTVTTSVERNVVTLGVDWRHYQSVEYILRAVLDYLNKNGGGVVPVDLISFNAKAVSNRVEITWETGSEYNSDRFEVERATMTDAGKSLFSRISEIQASGKSNSVKAYGPVIDKNVTTDAIYVYRLKMIDLDGSFNYSDEIQVSIGSGEGLTLGSPVPNPASNQAFVNFSLLEDANVTIELYDVTGKMVKVLMNGYAKAGNNLATFDLQDIPSGSYTYILRIGNTMLTKQLQIVK